jgi:hypothetical protein
MSIKSNPYLQNQNFPRKTKPLVSKPILSEKDPEYLALSKKDQKYTVTQEALDRTQKHIDEENKRWVRNGLMALPGIALYPFSKAKDLIDDIKNGDYKPPSGYV